MNAQPTLGRAEIEARDPCDGSQPLACAKRRLPTLAALIVAVASTIVMTLAGCASPGGTTPSQLSVTGCSPSHAHAVGGAEAQSVSGAA